MKDYNFTPKDIERFWSKVQKRDDCWEWTASVNNHGRYGQFKVFRDGKHMTYIAHRMSYVMEHGLIPDGMELDHVCHNRRCVNPGHLRTVTHKQNQENFTGAFRTSKSGMRGVYFNAGKKRWYVQVTHNGVVNCRGTFATAAEAEVVAVELRNKLFTHNDADRIAA